MIRTWLAQIRLVAIFAVAAFWHVVETRREARGK